MKIFIYISSVLLILFAFSACEDYVQDVDPMIDQVQDERLNDEGQLNFLLKGVKHRFGTITDDMSFLSGGLSDELYYDNTAPGASYPTLQEIDLAEDITRDNNSVDNFYTPLGELRFFADDLVRRASQIGGGAAYEEALFTGYLYGGMARYYYATVFGLTQNQGGGIVDGGPFVNSDDMYDLALERLQSALEHTDFTNSSVANADIGDQVRAEKVVHSIMARIYLFKGDVANAATHAALGLKEGDEPFQALFNDIATNTWYYFAGQRNQYVVDDRFAAYVTADANEANRLQLVWIDSTWWQQNRYVSAGSPINVMTWQENELMLAELELTSDNPGALARVNAVRASHGIGNLAALDLNALIAERDKELWSTGIRLPDQRRFDIWHLAPGTWHFLPITQNEINGNSNVDAP